MFHGVDGALRIREGWLDAWAEHRIDVGEMIERDEEIVVEMRLTGRGRQSGVEAEVRLYPHVTVRDGKVVFIYEYEDRDSALKSLGME